MRIGLLVLVMFASAWASLGLRLSGAAPGLVVVPIAVSLALLAWGWRDVGLVGSRGPHVGRVVGRWSAVEVIAIIVATSLVQYLHRDDLIFPAVVIIVGLHFFPLARGIPARLYYATGAGLVLAGIVALLLPAGERANMVCLGAALILWATSLAMVLRARQLAEAALVEG